MVQLANSIRLLISHVKERYDGTVSREPLPELLASRITPTLTRSGFAPSETKCAKQNQISHQAQ